MSLVVLGKQYGTDKVFHGYLPYYEQWFTSLRDDPITLLEIGILKGYSLRMWRDYFSKATIIGVDSDKRTIFQEGRIRCYRGEQQDPAFLKHLAEIVDSLDIVIDDGGHLVGSQAVSFMHLWPIVKPNGWYCIEDCSLSLKLADRGQTSVLKFITRRCQRALSGRSSFSEFHLTGYGRKSGLIALRKR